jgi:hypothetical protein
MSLGIGAMLSYLGGNEKTVKAVQNAIGKDIVNIACDEAALRMALSNGKNYTISDDGQSCCESRYMSCDDVLQSFVGATISGIEQRDGSGWLNNHENTYTYGSHDVEFVVISTNKGAITLASHNEHNGYYGGFGLRMDESE